MNKKTEVSKSEDPHIAHGKSVMQAEANSIVKASEQLGATFSSAVDAILNSKGKVVICGVGKSGHIAKKISTTFMSGGVDCVFLHASEAIHGDLGIYKPGDVTIVFSKSGSTSELVRLMPVFKAFESTVIAIIGRKDSPIGHAAEIVIDGSVEKEADLLNLMPTTSASVALAIGDALASAVISQKGLTPEEFARYHPGGQLGRNLLLKVGQVMHKTEKVGCVTEESTLREAVLAMNDFPLGAACVLDQNQCLKGLITDGDIRRLLSKKGSVLDLPISECATKEPTVITADCLIREALRMMEDRPSPISIMPVIDRDSQVLQGLVRLHDIYQADFS